MTADASTSTCPHCTHPWVEHSNLISGAMRCHCGCMWPDPSTIPPPPEPPTARDELIATIENTIWNALDHQQESGGPFSPYVDREMGMVDASGAGLDMTAVAAAVAALFVDDEDDCTNCHSPCAIHTWKTNPTGGDE